MFSDNTMLDGGESLVCDYDLAGRRTRIADATGAAWFYDYDSAGRLVRGVQKNVQGARSAGRQFEFGFDDIGNRRFARSGGDSWGTGLRQSDYEANALNQYTRRTVPGVAEVQGTADPAAVVTVNNERATRQGAYYRAELQVQNTNGAVYLAVTNLGVLAIPPNGDVAVTNTGRLFVPGTPETFEHDLDGNLLSDGRFTYTWDEENQLKSVETATGTPSDWRMRAEFTYDPEGRRAVKSVYAWTNAAWTLTKRLVFIYDGWNLLAEVDATGETPWVTRDYGWGLDLSGSMQGAGGVGGLLWVDNWPGTSAVEGHFVQHDIRGNVILLWSDADNAATARYEYGPFGELLRATGPMAMANPLRFSTKYQDDETDLLYYGYRYEKDGRWLSRDPIEEQGGLNVYGFAGNDPNVNVDFLGLIEVNIDAKEGDPCCWPGSGTPKLTADTSSVVNGYQITLIAKNVRNVGGEGVYTNVRGYWWTCWLGDRVWVEKFVHGPYVYNPYTAPVASGPFTLLSTFKLEYLWCDPFKNKWAKKHDLVMGVGCQFIHKWNSPSKGDHWECSR